MGTITIAATYGAGGSIIGPAVAERLHLPFVDRAIPTAVVAQIHKPLVSALADDSIASSRVGRLFDSALSYTGLFAGVPFDSEQMGVEPHVAKTEVAIKALADAGGAVILGRAGVFVLKQRSDVFHVRLDGEVEARRRAAMEHDRKNAARHRSRTPCLRGALLPSGGLLGRSAALSDGSRQHSAVAGRLH
jgi:hypothetical protein